MRFWPTDSFEIETTLAPEQIIALLKTKIEPKQIFRFSGNHAEFEGNVSIEEFKINRIIGYQNSCLPIIEGTFHPSGAGTRVAIRMGLHPFVRIFMCVWFSGVGLGILLVLGVLFSGRAPAPSMLLIPFAMLVLGWALVSGSFWYEAKKQKPMLMRMLGNEGHPTGPDG